MMQAETHWDRLARSLDEAGIEARVWTFRDNQRITLRSEAGLIEIRDSYWHDRWTGWQAWLEGADSIVISSMRRTKKRGEVVAWVLRAVDGRTCRGMATGEQVPR